MRSSKLSSFCSIFIFTAFILLAFSSTSFSQWVDKSSDLEGMSTGTVILIGVGVAAAVVAVILIANSGSAEEVDNSGKENEEEGDTEENSDEQIEGGTSISLLKYNLKNKHNEFTEKQLPLNVYLSMKRNNFQFSDNTFEIGLAVNF